MEIELVPMKEIDRPFFRQAHHRSYRSVVESMFGWDEAYQDGAADIDFNERNPHIIIHNKEAVGIVGWQETDHLWFGPLFILPECQNRGIGTLVVRKFIEQSCFRKLPLRLQTLRQNIGAKRLYEKLGFHVVSVSDIHWQMEYTPTGIATHV